MSRIYTMVTKVCVDCGLEFQGNVHQKRCERCRIEHSREYNREHVRAYMEQKREKRAKRLKEREEMKKKGITLCQSLSSYDKKWHVPSDVKVSKATPEEIDRYFAGVKPSKEKVSSFLNMGGCAYCKDFM